MPVVDLVTSSLNPQDIKVSDYNPNGSLGGITMYSGSPLGRYKRFNGVRGEKRNYSPTVINGIRTVVPPLNPVTIIGYENTCLPSDFQVGNHPVWGTRRWQGPIGSYFYASLGCDNLLSSVIKLDASFTERALQRAYGNIRRPEWDSQIFFGEIGETIQMLRNPIAGLLKISKNASKSRSVWRKLKAIPDATADLYLQSIFGIAPLIDDVNKVAELLEKKLSIIPVHRSGGKMKEIINHTLSFPSAPGLSLSGTQYTVKYNAVRKVVGKVYFNDAMTDSWYRQYTRWGLSPLQVPITAWQLYPLSFVVDWFVGVTTWMRAMMPKPGVTILGNCVSEKYEERITGITTFNPGTYYIGSAPPTYYKLPYMLPFYERKYDRLVRITNQKLPTGLYEGPGLDKFGKIISSCALSWQQITNNLKHMR